MKLASASLALALALSALPALAEPSTLYFRLDGGVSMGEALSGDYRTGTGLGGRAADSGMVNVGLGASLPIPFLPVRSEFDVGYRPNYSLRSDSTFQGAAYSTSSSYSSMTAIENVLIDIPLPLPVKPFIGVGAGIAMNRLAAVVPTYAGRAQPAGLGQTNVNLAWNAVAGLGFSLAPGIGLDLTYRYLDAGDLRTSGIDSAGTHFATIHSQLNTSEVMAGIRIGL